MESSELDILTIWIIIGIIWLLPFLAIITSSKTSGGEKIAWILAVLFVSWFAWIFYMLLAPIKSKNKAQNFDQIQYLTYINQKSTTAFNTGQSKNDSAKPSLKVWLKDNPGKSINEYYAKYNR